jgi:hypothetical protein
MLTQERLKEIFIYDAEKGIFTRINTTSSRAIKGAVAGSINSYGYLRISVDGRDYFSHRLAWLYEFGEFPPGLIDHINGDRKDNRISNLRQASLSQNGFNRRIQPTNTSGIKGVSWCKRSGQWRAIIMCQGKSIHVGYFKEKSNAANAISKVRDLMHGKFANYGTTKDRGNEQ